MKYIPADKLIKFKEALADIIVSSQGICTYQDCKDIAEREAPILISSLQQEQPIEGKQVIIITETNGDANIHWDCRSLDDVNALLASAQSFIADKQIEELRGQGSGPDYNTTEGRFRNAYKFQQEQPEVDLEKEINACWQNWLSPSNQKEVEEVLPKTEFAMYARHFYELGKARKEE